MSLFISGIAIGLIAAHFIAKFIERKLAKVSNKWVRSIVPLIALLASFAAIMAAIAALVVYTAPGDGFSR